MRERLSRRSKILLASVSAFCLGLAVLELFSFSVVSAKFSRVAGAKAFFHSFWAGMPSGEGCSWGDYVGPNPYLGFSYRNDGACVHPGINEYGVVGRPIPREKDPRYFSVLVLGGSVPEQLTGSAWPGPNALEKVLNRDYVSPNGKPFRVLNGAIAAGQYPMQVIAFLLFGDAADAVITLDGYNEHWGYGASFSIQEPPQIWKQIAAIEEGHGATGFDRFAHGTYRWLSGNPVLSHSYTAFLVGYSLAAIASRQESSTPIFYPQLPGSWSEKKRKDYFISQYSKYLTAIQEMAADRGIRSAFFLQPVPALFKPLSPHDRQVVGDLSYGPEYQEMVRRILGLRSQRLRIFSLLETFKDYPGDLFVDPIHFLGNSPGYEMLSEKMARDLQSAWNLKRRR